MTNAELRKALVAELNSKKPNSEKVASLQKQIDEMEDCYQPHK